MIIHIYWYITFTDTHCCKCDSNTLLNLFPSFRYDEIFEFMSLMFGWNGGPDPRTDWQVRRRETLVTLRCVMCSVWVHTGR